MKKVISFLLIIAIVVCLCIVGLVVPIATPNNATSQYFCDAHGWAWTLDVDVETMNKEWLYNINGEFFAKYEDNLAMQNGVGDVVREMSDDYNFINQNDHTILDGNGILYFMNGNFKWFGDSYTIYNVDKEPIATIDFDWCNVTGTMRDMDGNIIAKRTSNLMRQDYIVSIFDGCDIDDESVLMMFASAYSDNRSDSTD